MGLLANGCAKRKSTKPEYVTIRTGTYKKLGVEVLDFPKGRKIYVQSPYGPNVDAWFPKKGKHQIERNDPYKELPWIDLWDAYNTTKYSHKARLDE